MKRNLIFISAVLLIGAGCFVAAFNLSGRVMTAKPGVHAGSSHPTELEWLRQKFQLSGEQFDRVAALHSTYRPTCEALCEKQAASNRKINALVKKENQVTSELKAALEESSALRVECQAAMLSHLYRTAALMPPVQGKRYLDAMLPEVFAMPAHEPKDH